MCEVKLFIISHTSIAQPLKFKNGLNNFIPHFTWHVIKCVCVCVGGGGGGGGGITYPFPNFNGAFTVLHFGDVYVYLSHTFWWIHLHFNAGG